MSESVTTSSSGTDEAKTVDHVPTEPTHVSEPMTSSLEAEQHQNVTDALSDSISDDGDLTTDAAAEQADDDYVEDDPYGDPNGVRARRRKRLQQQHPEDGDGQDESKRDPVLADACKEEGNRHYGSGSYDTAIACYTEALRSCPRAQDYSDRRAVYHCNRSACFLAQQKWEDALYDCDRALQLKPEYVKAVCRRAQALEKLQLLDDALRDYERWVELDPSSSRQAQADISRVKASQVSRDEKMKEEMMGKLKDLGNSVLGYFGLSMDNFKAVKDPNTGSYSISFQQNGQGGQQTQ